MILIKIKLDKNRLFSVYFEHGEWINYTYLKLSSFTIKRSGGYTTLLSSLSSQRMPIGYN